MPNWCQNQLTMTGATPEYRAWLEANGFSFGKMNSPRIQRKKTDNWLQQLDRCCNAWGTKCDLDDTEQRQVASQPLENGAAFLGTAWSPPMQAIEVFVRMMTGWQKRQSSSARSSPGGIIARVSLNPSRPGSGGDSITSIRIGSDR